MKYSWKHPDFLWDYSQYLDFLLSLADYERDNFIAGELIFAYDERFVDAVLDNWREIQDAIRKKKECVICVERWVEHKYLFMLAIGKYLLKLDHDLQKKLDEECANLSGLINCSYCCK